MGEPNIRENIGIIGLGNMGGPISEHVLAAGFPVWGWDILEDNRTRLERSGGRVADCEAIAGACGKIILSLPSESAAEEVCAQLARFGAAGTIIAECSTLPIACKQRLHDELQAAGIVLLDTPISGTGAQAVTGELSVYLSGDQAAIAAIRPLIQSFSKSTHDLGAFGNGMKMKILANLLVTIHNESSAEAMLLGSRMGLDRQTILDVLTVGAGNSKMLQVRGPMMVERRYSPATMTQRVYQKDLKLIGAALEQYGVHAPAFLSTLAIYKRAAQSDLAEEDTASILEVLDELSNGG